MIPETGIHYDIPFKEYARWEAVNNSLLWTLKTHSPLHAKTYMDNPPEPTEAFITGRPLHTLLLEPRLFNRYYCIMPKCDKRTKKGKDIYDAFMTSKNGREILTQQRYDTIDVMAEAIKAQVLYKLIQAGKAEVCIVWNDKKTGLLCKARLDYVHAKRAIIVDVKSTRDAAPDAFARSIYNYGYYQQAAFYCDGWRELTGDYPAFTFMPIEKTPPYAVGAYEEGDKDIIVGRLSYEKALKEYAECLESNTWPGYESQVQMIQMPDWALKREGYSEYEVYNE